jgi:hypothetical protein
MRHFDFERIYNEFCKYYKTQGENEYYSWIRDLDLDESKPYGHSRESFQWAKGMLNFLKEDADSKYYGIIVGLPIKSMNGNVYRERDLIAAALSIKGKHPSLNHKDEFWFNQNCRWGTLTVEDAKYEDGAVEAILKVPKSAVCPICNGGKMTELIDKKHIVNVSLEGTNNNAFEFTDPPFTLLTSDVLPGIPLARIKPLEQIVEEYVAGTKIPGSKNKMKIQPKTIEDTANSKVNTQSSNPDFRGEWGTPVTSDNQVDSQNDLAKTAMGNPAANDNAKMQSGGSYAGNVHPEVNREAADEDPAMQCPVGSKMNPATGKCEPMTDTSMESAPPADSWSQPTKGSDTSMPKPEDIRTGPSRNKPPELSAPSAGPFPRIQQPATILGTAPIGAGGVTTGQSPVSELLEEKVARIMAETKAAIAYDNAEKAKESINKVETIWAEKYAKLSDEHHTTQVYSQTQESIIKDLKEAVQNEQMRTENLRNQNKEELRKEQLRSEDLRVELRDVKNQFADISTVSNKFQHLTEDLKIQNADITRKYQNSIQNNLELSKKLTTANEEYLTIAKVKDELEEKLGHARNLAKKVTKIQI